MNALQNTHPKARGKIACVRYASQGFTRPEVLRLPTLVRHVPTRLNAEQVGYGNIGSSVIVSEARGSRLAASSLCLEITMLGSSIDRDTYSPMIMVQPSLPIQTSCTLPAATSILAPALKFCFSRLSSSGYQIVMPPRRSKCVVNP